jgi:hypothetical protein
MTERTEVRFKIYNKTNNTVSANSVIPFNEVDFNVGGLYDISTYIYTFLVAGTYMIGESHNKIEKNQGELQFRLLRGGITRIISRVHNTNGFSDETLNSCLIYKFLVEDKIFCFTGGIVKMNNFAYTTNDIYNSFWGIRLDY